MAKQGGGATAANVSLDAVKLTNARIALVICDEVIVLAVEGADGVRPADQ